MVIKKIARLFVRRGRWQDALHENAGGQHTRHNRIVRKIPELPQDVMDIGGAEGFFAHHLSPSDLPRLRPSLRSLAKLFMNSRAGIAGVPNQRAPDGTSDM